MRDSKSQFDALRRPLSGQALKTVWTMEWKLEDVDILPRPSRRLVLLGAGSAPGSHNRFSPLAVDEDEPMDVADHQDAVVVHDKGSEVSVDEEPPTAPDPEVVTTRGLTPAIRAVFRGPARH